MPAWRCPSCGRKTNILVGGAGTHCPTCAQREADGLPIVPVITEGGTPDPEVDVEREDIAS